MRSVGSMLSLAGGLLAAILGGCSPAPDSSPPSRSAAANIAPARAAQSGSQAFLSLLKLEAAGRIIGPHSAEAARRELSAILNHRTRDYKIAGSGTNVRIWASDSTDDYLLGMNWNGTKLVSAVNLASSSCYGPQSIKVDRGNNVWLACNYLTAGQTGAGLQEYDSSGTLQNTYEFQSSAQCPPGDSCNTWSPDGGWDNGGHVFAVMDGIDYTNNRYLTPGFYWWNAGDPLATPTFISAAPGCSGASCEVMHMDVDASGNLWYTFLASGGQGLGEVTNPTTSPSAAVVLTATGEYWDGVYASRRGRVLNIVAPQSRLIYQYQLPVTPSSTPINTLGPTPATLSGRGSPLTGAFGAKDATIVLGDEYGWLDIGTVSSNTWQTATGVNFYGGVFGAAYTPSDK